MPRSAGIVKVNRQLARFTRLLHTANQALCDAIKLKGECFDFPGFIAHMSAFKEMFKSKMAFINIQVEQGIIARRKGGKAAMN